MRKASIKTNSRILPFLTVFFALLLAVILGSLTYVRHIEPMLRARVIDDLTARFHSPVALDSLHISLLHGLEVDGAGLRILYLAGPARPDADLGSGEPMISVRAFQFRAGLRQLFEPTLRVITVQIQGAELHIPPAPPSGTATRDNAQLRGLPFEGILVDKLVLTGTRLIIETRSPGKLPLIFAIPSLTLTNVGRKQPLTFDATVYNPKPVGLVHSTGHLGPWRDDNPRDTPIDGSYSFSHADLATFKGLGGILTSNANYVGSLGKIAVDGSADVLDFRLAPANHPLPLHAGFHVIVDGTTGDTTLQPVHARLQRSNITATGSITRKPGLPGHTIDLTVAVEQGHIEDFLALTVRVLPPVLRGALFSRSHLLIPPGAGTVAQRMRLSGDFSITESVFSNPKLQSEVDNVSERALGWPEKAKTGLAASITSSLKGQYQIAAEQVAIPTMVFAMPGATVSVEGQYGLDGKTLDFHGMVRTQATASEIVGGWKGLLVMPFDRLLKRNGAGTEVPFKLNGTQADPKLALDFDHLATGHLVPR